MPPKTKVKAVKKEKEEKLAEPAAKPTTTTTKTTTTTSRAKAVEVKVKEEKTMIKKEVVKKEKKEVVKEEEEEEEVRATRVTRSTVGATLWKPRGEVRDPKKPAPPAVPVVAASSSSSSSSSAAAAVPAPKLKAKRPSKFVRPKGVAKKPRVPPTVAVKRAAEDDGDGDVGRGGKVRKVEVEGGGEARGNVEEKVEEDEEKVKEKAKGKGKGKGKGGYAPPETYAHLNGVPDALAEGLVLVLVGLNPGVKTAMVGHCYSDPTNRFWKYLHHGGLTPDRILPSVEDQSLPAKYSLGTTNLLSRPTLNQSELSEQELLDGVKSLEEKIGRFKPEAVCIVGKKIWESIYCVKMGVKKFPKVRGWEYGWQEGMAIGKKEGEGGEGEGWQGARVFVVPSTSGLVTMPQREMKAQWEVLGDWVNRRREARGIKVPLAP